ncbi:MAG: hypothetical protein KAQ68_00080 [Clostridiales bacterium]|nr:hypothetical protein [Clostridiales bacterium]
MNKKNNIDNIKNTLSNDQVSYSKLVKFFVPLGLATLMIATSNMLLNRCLGFIPNSEFYISSFSVARTLSMLFMSPVSAITLVVTSFTENKNTYLKVQKFAIICAIVMLLWFMILSYTPLGELTFSKLYNLQGELLDNALVSFRTIMFLPILFLLRNFFLATSIKLRNIRFAAIGSLLRVIVVILFSFFIPEMLLVIKPQHLPGFILFCMIFVESLVYALGVFRITKGKVILHIVQSLKEQNTYKYDAIVSYKKILKFALPLMLSFSIAQLIPSFSQSALALGQNAAVILSIYSISLNILHIISSFNFQLPQLVVNHDSFHPTNRHIIRRLCYILGAVITMIMFIVAFTKLGDYIFISIMKLSIEHLDVAKLTLKFALFYPAASIFMSYKRGKLIKIRKTGILVFERALSSVLPLILFLIIPNIPWMYGAGIGIIVLTTANLASGIFTSIVFNMNVQRNPSLITRNP